MFLWRHRRHVRRGERCQNVHDVQCEVLDHPARAVPEIIGRDSEAAAELASTAEDLAAVSRDQCSARRSATEDDRGRARCADRANTGEITETEEELKCPNKMDPWQHRRRVQHCRLPRRLRKRVKQ